MSGAAATPTLQVVVVTYNSANEIGACLDSLLPQLPPDGSSVTVLDNASTDETLDLVAAQWPQVELVRSGENLGFARGVNEGVTKGHSRFVLLLNPDTVVQPGCIDALLGLADRRPTAGFYGGRLLRVDGTADPSSCFSRPTMWSTFCFATGLSAAFSSSRLFNRENMGSWSPDAEREVDIISGCLLLADRQAWERLGGFDERFFMYGEDFDLGIRAGRLGYRPVVTPDATVVHLMGAVLSQGRHGGPALPGESHAHASVVDGKPAMDRRAPDRPGCVAASATRWTGAAHACSAR